MDQLLRHNTPEVWVERVRRSVRRKPEVSGRVKKGEFTMSKEVSSIVSFLGEVLRAFPEAKEAVLEGRENCGNVRSSLLWEVREGSGWIDFFFDVPLVRPLHIRDLLTY